MPTEKAARQLQGLAGLRQALEVQLSRGVVRNGSARGSQSVEADSATRQEKLQETLQCVKQLETQLESDNAASRARQPSVDNPSSAETRAMASTGEDDCGRCGSDFTSAAKTPFSPRAVRGDCTPSFTAVATSAAKGNLCSPRFFYRPADLPSPARPTTSPSPLPSSLMHSTGAASRLPTVRNRKTASLGEGVTGPPSHCSVRLIPRRPPPPPSSSPLMVSVLPSRPCTVEDSAANVRRRYCSYSGDSNGSHCAHRAPPPPPFVDVPFLPSQHAARPVGAPTVATSPQGLTERSGVLHRPRSSVLARRCPVPAPPPPSAPPPPLSAAAMMAMMMGNTEQTGEGDEEGLSPSLISSATPSRREAHQRHRLRRTSAEPDHLTSSPTTTTMHTPSSDGQSGCSRGSSTSAALPSSGAADPRAVFHTSTMALFAQAGAFNSRPASPLSASAVQQCTALREEGNARFRAGDYESAIQMYTEALHIAPLDASLHSNRATAYLLTQRVHAATAEALCALRTDPTHLRANWRAARGFLCWCDLVEARHHYRLVKRLYETRPSTADAAERDGEVDEACGVGSPHCRLGPEWVREKRAAELEASTAVDLRQHYAQCMRSELWAEAADWAGQLVDLMGGPAAPASVPYQARQLEASLHIDPRPAVDAAKLLLQRYPHCLELYHLHAKALFYTAHDARTTEESVALLREGRLRLDAERELVEKNLLQFAASFVRGSGRGGGDAAAHAALVDSWKDELRHSPSRSMFTQLKETVELFARLRDAGNTAYAEGQWNDAYEAYSRCLEVDQHNQSLLASSLCNRAAVSMQIGQWKRALRDVNDAIQYNPHHARAYARRARVHLRLFHQLKEAQPTQRQSSQWSLQARRTAMARHVDAVVRDLTRAVELAPSARTNEQLKAALEERTAFLRDSGVAPPRRPPAPRSPLSSMGGGRRPSSSDLRARRRSSTSSRTNTGGAEKKAYFPFFGRPGGSAPFSTHSGYSTYTGNGSNWRPPSGGRGEERPTGASSASCAANTDAQERQRLLRVLGLTAGGNGEAGGRIDTAVLSKAYHEAALRWHPDRWVRGTPAEQQSAERNFKEVNLAYHTLKEC